MQKYSTRFDFNDALLYVFPLNLLKKVLNGSKKGIKANYPDRRRDFITPNLMDLHWLPVKMRVVCKVLPLS